MIKALALSVISAAAGAVAMSLTIGTDDTGRTTRITEFFVPGGSGTSAANAGRDRDRIRSAPVLTSRGDIGSRGAVADRLVEQAAADPAGALRSALVLDGHWYRLDTVERIVADWAGRDPTMVLAYLQASTEFDPLVRDRLLATAFETWAGIDPDDVLRFLSTPRGQRLLFDERAIGHGVVQDIAIERPGELLLAAGNLPKGEMRWSMRDAAIESLVERDLSFALRQAGIEAPGLDRRQWIDSIIQYWVPRDPAGALDWAREFDREEPGTLQGVALQIAASDPALIGPLALCDEARLAYPLCER